MDTKTNKLVVLLLLALGLGGAYYYYTQKKAETEADQMERYNRALQIWMNKIGRAITGDLSDGVWAGYYVAPGQARVNALAELKWAAMYQMQIQNDPAIPAGYEIIGDGARGFILVKK